ncbi:hypothetical protein DSL72_006326 [Monilinia vaccinii-corymbosi]|uniref:Uncharacterized protein n=1 Tax=Monilinia vaccinii-corymbosi TaxID=61207 RepID=A0A8A3PLX5_9HELO|nr:hypothetical protein DSL72_006326 [Monilinia vaccinii-corymbosi]
MDRFWASGRKQSSMEKWNIRLSLQLPKSP